MLLMSCCCIEFDGN